MTSLTEHLNFLQNEAPIKKYTFNCIGAPQTFLLYPGVYSFECWGASGGSYIGAINRSGGRGSYVYGKIRIDSLRKLYIYVGEKGIEAGKTAPFGGGGMGDFTGGGASDIRIINDDSFISLKTRIIVAAGGAGAEGAEAGGSGGSLIGFDSVDGYSKGATQTSGGTGYYNGTFGKGGNHVRGGEMSGGGAGGYYGGGTGHRLDNYAGSGGSSFISGHSGCDAISKLSTENNIIHTGKSFHYSGFVFYDTVMIDGNSEMPVPSFDITSNIQIGNEGDGFVRIMYLSSDFAYFLTLKCKHNLQLALISSITFLLKNK